MKQLENFEYSTVLFVLDNNNSKDVGYCDMAKPLSESFNKTIILWPCPQMKVSIASSDGADLFVITRMSFKEVVLFNGERNFSVKAVIQVYHDYLWFK